MIRCFKPLAVLLALAATFAAQAQVDKPVRILVGFAPGGSADVTARLLGERMALELKQPVVIDNKPGAGGRIAAEALKNAPADGSTLLVTPIVVPVLAPLVFSKLNYQPATDFAPVMPVANYQFSLSVVGSHPAKGVKELVAWYKANPGQANFGSPAPGSLPHFFGVMIATGAGVDLVHVPFNGGGPLMNAIVGNQVASGIDALVDQIEMHRSGKTRILATSGATRSPLLPDVPTFAEAGMPEYSFSTWLGVLAPAGLPAPVLARMSSDLIAVVRSQDFTEWCQARGLETMPSTPEEFASFMAAETEKFRHLISAAGIRVE